MLRNQSLQVIYILSHFAVDFACSFMFYQMIFGSAHWYFYMLLYNFCAFALQMPLGLLADKLNRNAICAALGCIVIAISCSVPLGIGITTLAAGIGNSMFHIGGGIDVLNNSKENPTLLGLFVAPGAFGIYLGTSLESKYIFQFGQ